MWPRSDQDKPMQLDVFFASAVVVLAGLAVIGALVLVIVWEWRAICRTLHGHRPSPPGAGASRPGAGAAGTAAVRATGRWLPVGWLLAALVVLALDGRLVVFLTWATPSTLLVLGVGPWSASSGPPPSSTSHRSQIPTESPTTSASRSPPSSPQPSTRQR
jgi:hypothetical protein